MLIGATRGVADTVVPTVLQGVSFWVIMVPLNYYLSITAGFGINGLFFGIGISGQPVPGRALRAPDAAPHPASMITEQEETRPHARMMQIVGEGTNARIVPRAAMDVGLAQLDSVRGSCAQIASSQGCCRPNLTGGIRLGDVAEIVAGKAHRSLQRAKRP